MFAQLDTKSVYSFMDSVVDLNTYVKRAKELGYQSIGLMDRDNQKWFTSFNWNRS